MDICTMQHPRTPAAKLWKLPNTFPPHSYPHQPPRHSLPIPHMDMTTLCSGPPHNTPQTPRATPAYCDLTTPTNTHHRHHLHHYERQRRCLMWIDGTHEMSDGGLKCMVHCRSYSFSYTAFGLYL